MIPMRAPLFPVAAASSDQGRIISYVIRICAHKHQFHEFFRYSYRIIDKYKLPAAASGIQLPIGTYVRIKAFANNIYISFLTAIKKLMKFSSIKLAVI